MARVNLSRRKQQQIVAAAAHKYGIPAWVLWGVYGTETSFGANVTTSSAGAVGPFQFLPSTARSLGINPYDFRSAAFGAAKYLAGGYRSGGLMGAVRRYYGAASSTYANNVRRFGRSFPSGIRADSGGGGGSSPRRIRVGPSSTNQKLFGVRVSEQTGLDPIAYKHAQAGYLLGNLIASHRGPTGPLFASGLLTTSPPDPNDFVTSTLSSKIVSKKKRVSG